MFSKKQLNERIDKLVERVNKLSEKNALLERSVEFLCNHDRKDCVINTKFNLGTPMHYVEYIYDNKLCSILLFSGLGLLLDVVENNEDSCIIKEISYGFDKYYKLDKSSKNIVNVTNLYNKIDNIKDCENLKQSAEAIGDALSSIFSASKQKTQKKAKPSEKTKAKCECEKKSYKKGGKD